MLSAVNNRIESPKELLIGLVKTVELLIDVSVSKQSVFYLSSCIHHLHQHVKGILKHGVRIKHHVVYAQPSFAAFDQWLEQSLLDFSLASTLISKRNDISGLYYEWAFLRHDVLFDALLQTLHVLSTRDLSPLLNILTMETTLQISPQIDAMPISGDPLLTSLTRDSLVSHSSPAINIPSKRTNNGSENNLTLQPDVELPPTVPNFSYSYDSPVSSPPVDRVYPESLTRLPGLKLVKERAESDLEYKVIKSSSDEGNKRKWNESFLESGGLVLPNAYGHFPTPHQGQTLTSFLTSLSDNLPDLDRENAHFNVSEALISAFERIKIQKCQGTIKPNVQDRADGGSNEDVFGTVIDKKGDVDHPGTSKSSKKHRKTTDSVQNVFTETEESELEYWRQPRKPPPYLRKKPRACLTSTTGLAPTTSSSLTSSEDDELLSSSYSAENVALNLLRNSKVRDNQLPAASELQWIVSEHDAPQALLPLPKLTSESESDYNSGNSISESSTGKIDNHIRLRGNYTWAPPRPQIIFTLPPPPSMNILIKSQKCRCAGCGTKVELKYASTFRYCFYLGRYFCTGCHTGKKARLPQMIIHNWDFSPHPVSNFSATLLEKLQSDPVYNVLAINKDIYKKVKLNNFRNHRIQLGILIEYIQNCKSANYLHTELEKFPHYYSTDIDLYSLNDLVNLRFSTGLPVQTKEFVTTAIKHVLNCELCKGLGFICEICNKNEILFPFQINRITRCSQCASCFHLKCYNPVRNTCPKCLRISARRSNEGDLIDEVNNSERLNVTC